MDRGVAIFSVGASVFIWAISIVLIQMGSVHFVLVSIVALIVLFFGNLTVGFLLFFSHIRFKVFPSNGSKLVSLLIVVVNASSFFSVLIAWLYFYCSLTTSTDL